MGWLSGWQYRKKHYILEEIDPTGTISVTNGSKTVTGSGTNFKSWRKGDKILLPDGNWYEIEDITSDTELTITVNYPGSDASGQSYKMMRVGYQKRIKVHYGSGTDNGEDVYLAGKCKSDFGDVRFTASDGETLLPYEYETEGKVDGDYAIYWVKVDEIKSDDTSYIYVYYGNSDATYNGDPYQVFDWFEDFSSDRSSLYTHVGTATHTWDTANKRLKIQGNGAWNFTIGS